MPGHRPQRHLLTVKSFIAMREKNEEATVILILDLAKYFDSESLVDCLEELHKLNVKGKLYKLIYELNKDT